MLDFFLENFTEEELLETGYGDNVLHVAVRRKQVEVVKYLLGKEIGTKLANYSHEEFDDQESKVVISRTPLEIAQARAKEDSSFGEIVKMLSPKE